MRELEKCTIFGKRDVTIFCPPVRELYKLFQWCCGLYGLHPLPYHTVVSVVGAADASHRAALYKKLYPSEWARTEKARGCFRDEKDCLLGWVINWWLVDWLYWLVGGWVSDWLVISDWLMNWLVICWLIGWLARKAQLFKLLSDGVLLGEKKKDHPCVKHWVQ